MTEIKLKTRKEYLKKRLNKAVLTFIRYEMGLEIELEDDKISLDKMDELIAEIEQLPITIDIIKNEYKYQEEENKEQNPF